MSEETSEQVSVRISAYQIGNRGNPRFVWSMGIPTDFLNNLPETQRRMKVIAQDDVLIFKLGEEGVKISTPRDSKNSWAGSMGPLHLTGIDLPTTATRSHPVEGLYFPDAGEIVIAHDLPEVVVNAIEEHKRKVAEFTEATDERRHFPATHFQEDVQQAASAQPTSPPHPAVCEDEPPAPVESPAEAPAAPADSSQHLALVEERAAYHPVPVNVADWSDDNVRRLRELVRDMQANRPDVILSFEDGMVRFQKQILTDI